MENVRSDFYVYVLLDPSKGDTPFYVGKGRSGRHINHYGPGYVARAGHKSHTIRAYRALGFADKHHVVEAGLTEQEAFKLEIAVIDQLGRRCDGGVLVNQAKGGQGASGISIPRTEEWKRKIAEANRKPKSPQHVENMRKAMLGKKPSPEHKAKISAALKGRPKSAEHVAAVARALTGRKLTPDHLERVRAQLRGFESLGKWHRITAPDGTVTVTQGLAKFCRDNGLSNQLLGQVALGRRTHHKGWKAEFTTPPVELKSHENNSED